MAHIMRIAAAPAAGPFRTVRHEVESVTGIFLTRGQVLTRMYSDEDIDDAIERIASDVARRLPQPEFHGPAMAALVDELRRMEVARRSGDHSAAALIAEGAQPALESYRPTNATSRSKAVLAEVVADVQAHAEPRER